MATPEWDRGTDKKLKCAFYCHAKGYFHPDIIESWEKKGPDKTEIVSTIGALIKRNTIKSFCNDDYAEAIGLWRQWKTFGLPNSGGYMDQPGLWSDIIGAISESEAIMAKGNGHG
jgi:hypothetical protein